jgi:phage gpG-like protein
LANIEVKWDDESHVVRFTGWLQGTLARAKKALHRAGLLIEGQTKKNLSGKRTPGNPYPGWVTSRLRGSVTTVPSSDGMVVAVGPHTVYARIHEYGGQTGRGGRTTIPARPYLGPAWKQKRSEIIKIMTKAMIAKT